ncbi:hypothetical protein HK103_002543 [Boothiomyces macroporosus]|uniref:Uncharacterized protein n=2 Tax=Boothiomyces macroporosus TaxID=261099 RepID=A0AAD5UJR8_9FUNG|nr:hypothetical protein HK103_002543 [Boothiomyces macroporosus]
MPPSTTNKEQTHALWTTSQPPVPTVTYIVPTVWTTANQPVQTSIIPTTPINASDKFKARLDDPIDSREYDSAPFPKRNPPNQYAFPSTSRENGSYFSADSTPRPSIDYSSNSAPPQTMMDYNNRQYQSVYANESQRPSFDYTSNESISPPTNGSDQISNAPAVTAYQYQGYTRPGPYAPTSGSLSPYFSTNAASNSAPGSDTYSYGPNASNTSSPGVGNYIPVAPADITPRTSFTYPPIVPGNSFSVHNPPYNWKGNDPNKNFNSPVGTSYSRPKPYEQPENAEIPILDQSENAEIPILDLSEQAEIPVIIKKQKQENEHRVEGVSQSAVRENEGKGENTIDMPPIIDSKK